MTTSNELLRQIDPLSVPERNKLVARTALAERGTPGFDRLLADLAAGGDFGTQLALTMAIVARTPELVLAQLESPNPRLAGRAWVAAVRGHWLTAEHVGSLLRRPRDTRLRVYRELRRRTDPELADRLLPPVRETFGDREAGRLLPACGPATVAAELPGLAHAVGDWAGFGRRHPIVVLQLAEAALAEVPEGERPSVFGRYSAGIWAAVPAEPGRVLDLLQRFPSAFGLSGVRHPILAALARCDRDRLLSVLLSEQSRRHGLGSGSRGLWRALRTADDTALIAVARTLSRHQFPRFLESLAPSRRAAVYVGVAKGRDPLTAGWQLAVLDLLPTAARVGEAQRCLALPWIADDPALRLEATARLRWVQAEPVLRKESADPDAERRANAYRLLVVAAAGERDESVIAGLLASWTRLTNEQDPVRGSALAAVAELPEHLLSAASVAALQPHLDDALRAPDSSDGTRRTVGRLAVSMLREGVRRERRDWVDAALAVTDRLVELWVRPALDGLDDNLPRGAETELWQAFRSRVAADERRHRYGVAVGLAAGLGRRGWGLTDLQDVLGRAIGSKDDAMIAQAAELWLADPARRSDRVGAALAADRSLVVLPQVQQVLAGTRTDLLDTVLDKAIRGRFLDRRSRYLPIFARGFDRWLPRQVDVYARVLTRAAGESDGGWQRLAAVNTLGLLPGSADRVRPFLADQDPVVVQTAILALSRSDRPAEQLPQLLAMTGDQARAAVPAVSRVARFVSPEVLAVALPAALTIRRVTVRKELVRLLAGLHIPGAAGTLAGLWAESGQHRDVRIAVVGAARELLPDPRMWQVLEQAAENPETARAVLAGVAERLPPDQVERYAALVDRIAGSTDPELAVVGIGRLAAFARHRPAVADTLVTALVDLDVTGSWRAAATALVETTCRTGTLAPLRAAAGTLASDQSARVQSARDLPARQRLIALLDTLAVRARWDDIAIESATLIADDLIAAGGNQLIALRLQAAALPWAEPELWQRIQALLGRDPRPRTARDIARAAGAGLRLALSRVEMDALLEVAVRLAGGTQTVAAELALELVTVCGPETGWDPGWVNLLHRLRSHPDPEVAEAAMLVFSATE